MDMIEVKTDELVDAALDWAVGMATGWESDRPQDGQIRKGDIYALVGPKPQYNANFCLYFSPSTDWSQGGPLQEEFVIRTCITTSKDWYASTDGFVCGASASGLHQSVLVAICRAIVSSRLGDVVQIPSQLVNAK